MKPSIRLTPEILSLISELDEFKGRWSGTQLLKPERLSSLKKVATIESIGSSTRIEGSKLSDAQVEDLLRSIKIYSFRSRDEQEVGGYAETIDLIFHNFNEIPFNENHIKQLHSLILKYSEKDERHRGEYKKFPNSVEAFDSNGKSVGVVFQSTSPFDTPSKMKELIEWTSFELSNKKLHPLLIISIFIIYFLQIHPFQDGNGRLSRILTTLLLLQSGYSYVPYSSMEHIIEENKDLYYLALRQGQTDLEGEKSLVGNWILFFLQCLRKQKQNLEKKLQTEKLLEKLPPLSMQILEIIKARGQSSIGEILDITQANRNTLKLHLKNLILQNHLATEGKGKGTRYRISTPNPPEK